MHVLDSNADEAENVFIIVVVIIIVIIIIIIIIVSRHFRIIKFRRVKFYQVLSHRMMVA